MGCVQGHMQGMCLLSNCSPNTHAGIGSSSGWIQSAILVVPIFSIRVLRFLSALHLFFFLLSYKVLETLCKLVLPLGAIFASGQLTCPPTRFSLLSQLLKTYKCYKCRAMKNHGFCKVEAI